MSIPKFAETYNVFAFLEKPEESNGFEGIIDFLDASSNKYALTTALTGFDGFMYRLQGEGSCLEKAQIAQARRLLAKDKGKAIMVEPKKYLKKKDQIALDEEVARNLEAQLQAELEEETLARQKERRTHHSLN
ncbi:hypothetical protein Tco_0436642 [Tanacetum coccineum]